MDAGFGLWLFAISVGASVLGGMPAWPAAFSRRRTGPGAPRGSPRLPTTRLQAAHLADRGRRPVHADVLPGRPLAECRSAHRGQAKSVAQLAIGEQTALFVEELATGFTHGPRAVGAYHWEPVPEFATIAAGLDLAAERWLRASTVGQGLWLQIKREPVQPLAAGLRHHHLHLELDPLMALLVAHQRLHAQGRCRARSGRRAHRPCRSGAAASGTRRTGRHRGRSRHSAGSRILGRCGS